nr:EamA-like transporter family [uncultured bacterium]
MQKLNEGSAATPPGLHQFRIAVMTTGEHKTRQLQSNDRLGLLLGFIGVATFAGSLPATRIAVSELTPWFVTSARASIAAICAIVLLAALRRPLPPRNTWLPLFFVACGVVLGFPLFSGLAMQTVPAAHGGVIIGILPLGTAVAAALFAHERPSGMFWIAGIFGAAIVVAFSLRHGNSLTISTGDLWLLAAIGSASVGYTMSGKLARNMPGWEVISWACVLALPVFGTLTFILWPQNLFSVSPQVAAGMAYVGLVSQFLGFFAWNAGLAMGGIARVGQMQLMQPFITVGIAAVFNNEPVEIETLAFAAAVVATVLIGLRTRATTAQP